jgi:transposase
MKSQPTERIDLDLTDLQQIVARASLTQDERDKLMGAISTLAFLTHELQAKRTSIDRLRKMLFGASTEKISKVCANDAASAAPTSESGQASDDQQSAPATPPPKRKGHGRNAAATYRGAARINIAHPTLKPGDRCPECLRGNLYEMDVPAVLVRIKGQAPLAASVYQMQRLRCASCGQVFQADDPPEVGPDKYDPTAAAMICLLKYAAGLPFYRLSRLQAQLGIPLPAATQWQIVRATTDSVRPAFDELVRQAAQGKVLHNDDTIARILSLMKGAPQQLKPASSDDERDFADRTGMFTSGIVSFAAGARIALFFTGRRHAGENLTDVLRQRSGGLDPPIQMCDALSRNIPDTETILVNCLAHDRRKFVDVIHQFPHECQHVLETIAEVYRNDSAAAEQDMSPQQRLAWHQASSGPLMKKLEDWLNDQIDSHKVEPNSGLGEAIAYTIKHWHELTQFLRVASAPLDNNIVERALKLVILHRKNALFFKTLNGAHAADTLMSLIHTAQLNGADPFHYLVALLRHNAELRAAPAQWMPWNYQQTLTALDAAS